MKKILFMYVLVLMSCGNNQNKQYVQDAKAVTDTATDVSIVETVKEAYFFGYPLVVMETTKRLMTNVAKPFNKGRLLAPVNQLVSANTFPDDKFRDVVRPNCDTYYTQGWVDLDEDSLKSIPVWAKHQLSQHGFSGSRTVNGWSVNRGLGNYGTQYTFRAGTAYGGLGANLDADAMYPVSMTDADGDPYDGSKHKYILHFDSGKLPPANAFWSLTMYSNDGFLCSNPIHRFVIGDRNSLKKNADGSLDIFIQKDDPGNSKKANWLPTPNGPFNLLLRVYWPKKEMTTGNWQTPPVKKTAG